MYRMDENESWIQIGEAINGDSSRDESGHSISLSEDGSVLAIGAARMPGTR